MRADRIAVVSRIATMLLLSACGPAPDQTVTDTGSPPPPPAVEAPTILFPASQWEEVALRSEQSTGRQLEALIGSSASYEPLAEYAESSDFRKASRAVGRLKLAYAYSNGDFNICTGILTEGNFVLTAHHCFKDDDHYGRVADARFELGYYNVIDDGSVRAFDVETTPVRHSKELDYALARVEGNPTAEWGHAIFTDRLPEASEPLFVIHHPAGVRKQITRFKCRAAQVPIQESDLLHQCDTVPGSSGAPIYSSDSKHVIALHYAGFTPGDTTVSNYGKLMKKILAALGRRPAAEPEPDAPERDAASLRVEEGQRPAEPAADRRGPPVYEVRRGPQNVIMLPDVIFAQSGAPIEVQEAATPSPVGGGETTVTATPPAPPPEPGCQILVTNPFATIKSEPDTFSIDIMRLPPGVYEVDAKRTVRHVREQLWYLVAANGQSGWLHANVFNVEDRQGDRCF